MTYTPVIGLEVHVELKTLSKMFCSCRADYFGKEPNSHTCPVCLGLPGALPVPNKKAIEWCIMIALALNCNINKVSKFDRKNYFYPDLAKGYQISQYDQPFGENGNITLSTGKKIGITRVHMEEDTGKLTHSVVNGQKVSLIDFNRSGVPLVEIVTEPDFTSAEEVIEYLKKLQQIVRYLGVSNADMEKGEMRLEPNISLRPNRHSGEQRDSRIKERSWTSSPRFDRVEAGQDDALPKYKVEVKNINSFRFVEKAIQYEIKRQSQLLDNGEKPAQETRGWNEAKNNTVSQRSKENAHDYRYFPEPDIPPIHFTQLQITSYKLQIPELPDKKFARFIKDYALSPYDTEILTRELDLANYFEEAIKVGRKHNVTPKQIANMIINKKVDIQDTVPAALIELIKAETAFEAVDDTILQNIIAEVIKEQGKAVAEYKAGKENVIMFLLGQVMRKIGKKVDANLIKVTLQKSLK